MSAYQTMAWGEKFGVCANWAQASDQVYSLDCDGNWTPTQYQVADFCHDNKAALRRMLEECAIAGGGLDGALGEIEYAMDSAAWVEEENE